MSSMPALRTLIQIFIETPGEGLEQGSGQNLPSKVEDVIPASAPGESDQLLIAAPSYSGDVELPLAGTVCALVWATRREMLELPVAFVGEELSGPLVRVWRMQVTGAIIRLQRRGYGRVPMSLPVRVSAIEPASSPATADTDEPEVHEGTTIDLSEGGILCRLTPPPLATGTEVLVQLTIDDAELGLRATILRAPATGAGGADDRKGFVTAIRFDNPDEYGDTVRRVVFSEELRGRKAAVR